MTTKQTLKQALYLASSGKSHSLTLAAGALSGKPEGGWPETQQALNHLRDELPAPGLRSYTASEFVAGAYTVDANGYYRSTL